MGAYNRFIEQNVKKSVEAAQASCELDQSLDQQIKKNIENFLKKNSAELIAKQERTHCVSSRIQNDILSNNERANVNISNLSTQLSLCSNIKSIRPIYTKSTQNQSPLMLSSSPSKTLAAPISLLATKSKSPSIPSTLPSPNLLNYTTQSMAKVTNKKKSVTPPTNYNEKLILSNLVKRELISKYSPPSTTCTTGPAFNNLQLLYPPIKFEQIHQNAIINPPQLQIQSTIQQQQHQQHGQSSSQRSKEFKTQQFELQQRQQQHCQQTQKKHSTEQLQKVPQNQQKYIINNTNRSAKPYSTNYARNKIKIEPQSPSSSSTTTTTAAHKICSSQDQTLLSEPSAPISELNTSSISQAFLYNQLLSNLKNNLLQNRLLGVSSEDN